jgi:hypothetical protein
VTPEHAAKKLVAAQTVVKGPGRTTVALPKPQAVQGYYRDIAVLAAPVPDDATSANGLVANSQYQNYGPALAEDGDDETRWVSNGHRAGMGPTPDKPEYLQFNWFFRRSQRLIQTVCPAISREPGCEGPAFQPPGCSLMTLRLLQIAELSSASSRPPTTSNSGPGAPDQCPAMPWKMLTFRQFSSRTYGAELPSNWNTSIARFSHPRRIAAVRV